jgi:hypothetical protein
MPLVTDQIRTILQNKGLISFVNSGTVEIGKITTGINDAVVDNNYTKLNLSANTGDNKIVMSRVNNGSNKFNGVNIFTVDGFANTGTITAPGYVYTGDFSGCVFYLYKNAGNQITGVHAYSGLFKETATKGRFFWKKKIINEVVRESSPVDYFTRNPGTQICRYPTRGEINILGGEMSLAFLSCVERTTATTFLFAVKNSAEGARVMRVLHEYNANF